MAGQRPAGTARSADQRRRRELLTGSVLALAALPVVARSEDQEALDEDFLEYLAEFDDKDDDWRWFARDDVDDEAKQRSNQTPTKPKASVEKQKS